MCVYSSSSQLLLSGEQALCFVSSAALRLCHWVLLLGVPLVLEELWVHLYSSKYHHSKVCK
jgi:hypothetical protein